MSYSYLYVHCKIINRASHNFTSRPIVKYSQKAVYFKEVIKNDLSSLRDKVKFYMLYVYMNCFYRPHRTEPTSYLHWRYCRIFREQSYRFSDSLVRTSPIKPTANILVFDRAISHSHLSADEVGKRDFLQAFTWGSHYENDHEKVQRMTPYWIASHRWCGCHDVDVDAPSFPWPFSFPSELLADSRPLSGESFRSSIP